MLAELRTMKNQNKKATNLIVEYEIPITENMQDGNDLKIRGIAINETTTSNGHKFVADELQLSAGSLMGVPLLKDHNNSIDSIVGRVIKAEFDPMLKNIRFEARVMDPQCKQMILDGRLNSVSVGATVKELEEIENGEIIPRGITFKELSLVAIPADSNANFSIALKEAWIKAKGEIESEDKEDKDEDIIDDLDESQSLKNLEVMKGGSIEMAETKEHEMTEQVQETKVAEKVEKVETVEKAVEIKVDESAKMIDAQKAEIESLKKQLAESKAPKAEEKAVEEIEVESKGLSFVQSHGTLKGGAITFVREKY